MKLEEFSKYLSDYGEKIDLKFSKKQEEQFFKYMNLLIEWNEKINLTAIVEPKEIILKHFIDSLTINKYIVQIILEIKLAIKTYLPFL